ncbi:hypothetical protein LTS08_001552 [Lithohypha guttulata]|uniref:uncharacterized protein n=1 Tax=Lithohypha guttulata TaxID=1690604 RepID=UPI002DE11FE8|nr:hypothetical protein LTR51_003780 [Lithohypha guttulata]KAK5105277.1 hypothetical protein LTS08_001552 [Lithohypha guttulata]
MKRVRTKSSDNAGNMEPPKKSKETTNGKRTQSPKDKQTESPKARQQLALITNNVNGTDHPAAKLNLKIISHGRVNGPLDDPEDGEEMLNFSVRDIPMPPAKLRKKYSGLSPRLRAEVFSEKQSRLKYDTIVTEMEKMMTVMETALTYDATHQEIDEETATTLIVSIQCEEGKHRSVGFAEELAQSDTTKRKNWTVIVEHRDLGDDDANGADEDDSDEPPTSPTTTRAKECVKTMKKKKDKNLKKARNMRLQVEVAESGAEDGFL